MRAANEELATSYPLVWPSIMEWKYFWISIRWSQLLLWEVPLPYAPTTQKEGISDIINSKARYNRIDAKYRPITFRSVSADPYLELLVKRNWCKFRGLCLRSMSIVILPNTSKWSRGCLGRQDFFVIHQTKFCRLGSDVLEEFWTNFKVITDYKNASPELF